MTPLRLELKNFLSYGETAPPLSFEGIHVACLSGANGAGKSSLLDAMVWALWGQPRGGSPAGDDLMHPGAREMQVALEFELDASRFRVTRRRVLRNKAGTTELHLEGQNGDEWRSLDGGTMRETQHQIEQLVRMSHDTFVHASFIQQGKADAFMNISPQQRKQVLGDILGLAQYDELATAAHEAGRVARSQADQLTALIENVDKELANREVFAQRLREAERDLGQASELEERLKSQRVELMANAARQDEAERRVTELMAALRRTEQRLSAIDTRSQELTRRIAAVNIVLGRAEVIEEAHATYTGANDEERVYAERFEQWSVLREKVSALEGILHRECARREAELGSVHAAIVVTEKRLLQATNDGREAESKRRELAALDLIAAELDTAERSAAEESERLASLRTEGERLKDEPDRAQQRLEILGQHDSCPLCGQPLGYDGLVAARTRLEQELQSASELLSATRASYQQQQSVVKAARAHADGLKQQIAGRQALATSIGDLEARLRRAAEDRAALEAQERRRVELETELAQESFALETRSELALSREAMEAVGYDPEGHRAVRETRDRLRTAPDELRQLEVARVTVAELEAARTSLVQETQEVELERDAHRAAHRAAAGQAAELAGAHDALRVKEAELQQAGALRARASEQLGEARQMVSWLEQRARERVQYVAEREGHLTEVNAYTQLAEAFGKSGIQEMIIDGALPEIEDGANVLLDRLSGGRMRVAIETQRTGRGGGTISTLDVNVSDELGMRPYELFSGGEKFRINFAVRIALSQLLARRANAPLRMLAIDEGFGSQDQDGCDRLVEAIKAVQDDFDRVLVITHLDELKEVFPVRIEVEKRAEGSTFTIN